MKDEYIYRAVKDTSNVLQPVLDAAWSLKPLSKMEVVEIALAVNKRLGYDLFDDISYPRLVHDFSLVSRMVAQNAMGKLE